jgi:hypothetical protein
MVLIQEWWCEKCRHNCSDEGCVETEHMTFRGRSLLNVFCNHCGGPATQKFKSETPITR